jgi:hypothetical protein
MSNAWIDNALKPAAMPVAPGPLPVAGNLDMGGPIGITVEPVDQFSLTAAFYDEESRALAVHILPFEPYHSYLEAGDVRIDTDAAGRPVYIEAALNRTEWLIDPRFALPAADEEGTIRFRETRRTYSPGEILASPCRSMACVKFLARRGERVVRFSKDLLFEIADGFLVAVWISAIGLDFGGRRQAKWRVKTASMLRRSGRNWQPYTKGKLSKS